MNHLQKITTRAKAIKKAHPKKIWTDCIKAAAKELKTGKPAPKKTTTKKKVAGLDKVVRSGNHTKVEYSRKPKPSTKKKPTQGKLFGVNEVALKSYDDVVSKIAKAETHIKKYGEMAADKEYNVNNRASFKKQQNEWKKFLSELKKQKQSLKKLL